MTLHVSLHPMGLGASNMRCSVVRLRCAALAMSSGAPAVCLLTRWIRVELAGCAACSGPVMQGYGNECILHVWLWCLYMRRAA